MAMRAFAAAAGLGAGHGVDLEVVGLADGYHGDTLGCMDAVAPSPYTGARQTPWYVLSHADSPPCVACGQGLPWGHAGLHGRRRAHALHGRPPDGLICAIQFLPCTACCQEELSLETLAWKQAWPCMLRL
jgi:hypothetical protein